MSTSATIAAPPASRAAGFSRADFEAFLQARRESAWLTARRQAAFDTYEQKLAEPLHPEEYKRVDLRAFQPARFAVGVAAPAPAQFETLLEKRAEFGGAVSHLDGHCIISRLDEKLASRGVLFGSLPEL